MQANEQWSSRAMFILAAIGSAVGIGNIWRFSSVLGQNGGGAYLIPYLIAVFLFAFPLMILEVGVGRLTGKSLISAFSAGGGRLRIAGWFVAAVILLILSYYLVVTGWTLAFACLSAANVQISFGSFTTSYSPLAFFFVSALVTGAIVAFGVRRGIERISRILVPLVFLILVGLVLFSITLEGFLEGVHYLFSPDFSVLSSPYVWAAALGQAFFSLSVGQGIMTTYGAYLSREVRIPGTMLIIAIADLSISLMAGLVIFPIVYTFGLEPTLGASLAFSTLPRAFKLMPLGGVVSLAFFALLFFAALTSAISMLEVPVSALMEALSMQRRRAALVLTLLLILLGVPSALSYSQADLKIADSRVLDIIDESVGTFGLILSALVTAVVFSWYTDSKVLEKEIGSASAVTRMVNAMCRYAIPVVLLYVLVYRIVSDVEIPALHLLSGAPFIGTFLMLTFGFAFLGAILAAILLVCWGRECRWFRAWRGR